MTFLINSVGHIVGTQRYETGDHSRNNMVLAVLSVGEGWHNNHHHYPAAAQAGFFWYEVDASFRLIRLAEFLGIVWDVRRVPESRLHTNLKSPPAESVNVLPHETPPAAPALDANQHQSPVAS